MLQDEIFSSSFAAAAYLESRNFDKSKKVRSLPPLLACPPLCKRGPCC